MGELRMFRKTMLSDLPEHLTERIMEFLPVECFFRFRTVCHTWNTLLSSEHFNSIARNNQPNLIFCSSNTQLPSLIYSFSSNTWRTISLSFVADNKGINFRGSASGLLLLDIPSRHWFCYTLPILYVCNPLRKTCVRLPAMVCVSSIMAKTILPAGNNTNGYDVMIVGRSSSDSVIVEVYNSMTESWKVAGTIPDELNLVIRNENMFFCKGCLFCMTSSGGRMMVYNIEHGRTVIVAIPVADWARLVCCKSRVFMVGATEENHNLKGIIMWELVLKEGKDYLWQEMGRMPGSVCDDFKRSSRFNWFECAGVGDKICFRAHESVEVVVYDINTNSWNWLPQFPAGFRYMSMRCLPLETMPNANF
ncbi:hypothetical protein KI387_039113 [Taxus chinensis]|uniref:F-box domain-containing protein n=1 Tax=Taxus chinensis TaxID=29808 RepID=A0AA38FB15_TAXCH|nr:hypothetical protein KI387_039113 [Taxus chinensis]